VLLLLISSHAGHRAVGFHSLLDPTRISDLLPDHEDVYAGGKPWVGCKHSRQRPEKNGTYHIQNLVYHYYVLDKKKTKN
jgi:hypothetical protein